MLTSRLFVTTAFLFGLCFRKIAGLRLRKRFVKLSNLVTSRVTPVITLDDKLLKRESTPSVELFSGAVCETRTRVIIVRQSQSGFIPLHYTKVLFPTRTTTKNDLQR